MVGEGGTVTFNPSPDIIHDQKTIYGSWVTSTWLMEELVERLVRWNLHPEDIVTHRFSLEQARRSLSFDGVGTLRQGRGLPDRGVDHAPIPDRRSSRAVLKPGTHPSAGKDSLSSSSPGCSFSGRFPTT